eukprot:Blabericola_migrator_1__2447@NODE_168_length_12126_cov_91_620864_g146_i0_p4_GENE_NODE_168_length_12126_cov_91_620864_g146_i0NODE_168_length_12126_cov_91_620864_g146_i0_p4_ORF_typecomplete_len442_score85_48Thioredoxin_6/PF13848_6/0_069Thioredoxin_6/PF13848_6/1_4e09Thioredoxin/PF00085_20/0_0002Thioredoxin/PF00085_20/0_036Thioredoxin/PF00085_20/7_6e02HyaE/PF07449_11/5e05HyaE/PF07449_11/4_5e03HyaE/PF07449_11/8_6e03_NODE_168_length_12126_cov_91_620864_g146_i069478272
MRLLGLLCLWIVGAAKPKSRERSRETSRETLVSPLKHDISIVTTKNFELSISKMRDRTPAVVLYYQKSPETKDFIETFWDPVAKDLKGMVKIGAADCDENHSLCTQQLPAEVSIGTERPYAIKVYPPMPMPPHMYQGREEVTRMVNAFTRLIPDAKITNITDDASIKAFLGDYPALPKVLLFTDKPKPSRLFHALSNTFNDRMMFGFVSGTLDSDLAKRFRVKKFPALLLKKGDLSPTLKGTSVYKGDLKFRDIHEWLNVHSETFVKGGGFLTEQEPSPQNITDLRPWLTQRIPELTKGSHNDVCFKKPRGLCVTYLKFGELTDDDIEMLERVQEKFKHNTKPELHFSWMNLDIESNYVKLFKLDMEDPSHRTPSLVMFNPHSRLRFSKLPPGQEATEAAIIAHIEKVVSGDGRFVVIKGNKVPAFAVRSRTKKNENKDEL